MAMRSQAEPAAPLQAQAFFADAPWLTFQQSEPLTQMAYVNGTAFGLSSGGPQDLQQNPPRISCYLGGLRKLVEIPLDGGAVKEHPLPIDPQTPEAMLGAYVASVGPDDCIYLMMNTKPGSVMRFNPATGGMERFTSDIPLSPHRIVFGPRGKAYLSFYLAHLVEFDLKTGVFRSIGRISQSDVYIWSGWIAPDGWFYCDPSREQNSPLRVDPATGQVEKLDKLPPHVPHPDTPRNPRGTLVEHYTVAMQSLPAQVTVTIRAKDAPAEDPPVRVASFTPDTSTTHISMLAVGSDGRIIGSGLHRQFIYDPGTGEVVRPNFKHSIADFVVSGTRVYFSGYPQAALGVYDTSRPLTVPWDGTPPRMLAKLTDAADNPRLVVSLAARNEFPESKSSAGFTMMNRMWTMAAAPDGRLFLGATSSRHSRGGALAAWDPADNSLQLWRTPMFLQLGVRAITSIDHGRQLAIATWVSADARHPEETPAEARLFLFDVAQGQITWSGVPLPGCKVLIGLLQAPAPADHLLIGMGLPGVNPTDEDDDSFYDDATLFFFDLNTKQTVATIPLAFRVGLREGRPFALAPDGTVWSVGGIGGSVLEGPHDGGIFRIDAATQRVTPVARVKGTLGNFVFIGTTMYLAGADRLRWADVAGLLRRQP
jgi:hypothetical protein